MYLIGCATMRRFMIIFLLVVFGLNVYADRGIPQEHLVAVSPEVSSLNVISNSPIIVTFDKSLFPKSINDRSIVVTDANRSKVKGNITLKDDKTLQFTPSLPLKGGKYEVSIKPLILELAPPEYKPRNFFEQLSYRACSSIYKDLSQCFLCQVFCHQEKHHFTTHPIEYSFSVIEIKSLTLSANTLELKASSQTALELSALFSDNSSQTITTNIEWIVADPTVASISNNIFQALKEGTTTLQARYYGKSSNTLTMSVYQEINGHKLPPEPDSKLNSATLLGVDKNNNGVRDDVERKILTIYTKPVQTELMLSQARAHQEMLNDPVGSAIASQKKIQKVGDCSMYLMDKGIYIAERVEFTEKAMYNTKARVKAYLDYNIALSGGVYGSGPANWTEKACDFDVKTLMEVQP